MDEVLQVIGLAAQPEGDVQVSLFNPDTGASTSFFVDEGEVKKWAIGRRFRVRVTRSLIVVNEGSDESDTDARDEG